MPCKLNDMSSFDTPLSNQYCTIHTQSHGADALGSPHTYILCPCGVKIVGYQMSTCHLANPVPKDQRGYVFRPKTSFNCNSQTVGPTVKWAHFNPFLDPKLVKYRVHTHHGKNELS